MDQMTRRELRQSSKMRFRESNRINCYDLIIQTRHWIRTLCGEQSNETEKYRRAFFGEFVWNSPAVIWYFSVKGLLNWINIFSSHFLKTLVIPSHNFPSATFLRQQLNGNWISIRLESRWKFPLTQLKVPTVTENDRFPDRFQSLIGWKRNLIS